MEKEIKAWERNYKNGRYNKWPYDILVSFVIRLYGDEPRNKTRILDLGSGGGNNTYFLAEEGFDTYAIDGSPKGIEITQKKLQKHNLSANLKVANFKNLPYQSQFFDCVVDRASIYCNFWKEIHQIFKEIYRVLKLDGRYIGFLPSVNHPDKKYGKEVEKNTFIDFEKGSYTNSDIAHFFDENEIRRVLKNFRIEEFLEHKSINLLNKKSDFIFSEFIIVAKK